ncbi:MAG: hypothetical protein ACJ8F7_04430, partial [Gemmataceae bacterium]
MFQSISRIAALTLVAVWGLSSARGQPPAPLPRSPAQPPAGTTPKPAIPNPQPANPAGQPAAEAGVHVETRGEIHEAFAQPYEPVVNPTAIVHKQPPDPIPEEPPSERPAGKNVQWIPGYWQWDDDRKDFSWISGSWRDVPEGRHWVVGHWTPVADGSYRVRGHWAAQQEPDFQYTQKPPEPKHEERPPAPDADSLWIPGQWFYTENGWEWRPGYYTAMRPGYAWQPASYYWSPNGYISTSGYWDYAPDNRGLLFAPVYFDQPLWQNSGWAYRPFYALNLAAAWASLFIRPGWGYYYGDWYGRGYSGMGYTPWYAYGSRGYDPLYNYMAWNNRGNPNWMANIQSVNQARINGTGTLPPRTLAATTGANALVTPLNRLTTVNPNLRLQTVTPQQRATIMQNAQLMHQHSMHMGQGNFPANFSTNLRTNPGVSRSFYPGTAQPGVTNRGAVPQGGFQQVAPIHPSFPGYAPHGGGSGGGRPD